MIACYIVGLDLRRAPLVVCRDLNRGRRSTRGRRIDRHLPEIHRRDGGRVVRG